ncbi:ADP-ribosylation/crystallin J1 [Mesorhizobium sp. BHbdii]
MNKRIDTVTLWRPVGPKELKLIEKSGMRAFPPRLPEQPIFYPVLSQAYAVQIARDWNVPASGSGFVTRFDVLKSFLDRYQVEHAGSKAHLEYWIPAEDLPELDRAIVGMIEVTAAFGRDANLAG